MATSPGTTCSFSNPWSCRPGCCHQVGRLRVVGAQGQPCGSVWTVHSDAGALQGCWSYGNRLCAQSAVLCQMCSLLDQHTVPTNGMAWAVLPCTSIPGEGFPGAAQDKGGGDENVVLLTHVCNTHCVSNCHRHFCVYVLSCHAFTRTGLSVYSINAMTLLRKRFDSPNRLRTLLQVLVVLVTPWTQASLARLKLRSWIQQARKRRMRKTARRMRRRRTRHVWLAVLPTQVGHVNCFSQMGQCQASRTDGAGLSKRDTCGSVKQAAGAGQVVPEGLATQVGRTGLLEPVGRVWLCISTTGVVRVASACLGAIQAHQA